MLSYKKNYQLDEKMLQKTLFSGTKCYIIPKSETKRKMAIIGYDFGSSDLCYEDDKVHNLPAGIAHFIEHKLFSQKWGDAFAKLDSFGVSANAFTDFNKTAYYFSGENNFFEAFEVLLNFVQNPHFVQEEIDKEKGIIEQEIKMYDDDKNWQVYFDLLNAMYFDNPVKENIAGTVDSIKDIDEVTLYQCYESFYSPNNAVIVVVGDVDAEKVLEAAEKLMVPKSSSKIKRIIKEEKDQVCTKIKVSKADVSIPLWSIGFKEVCHEADLKEIYGSRIILDLLFGEGSKLYNQLYEDGVLNQPIACQYISGRGYNASILSGIGDNPQMILEQIQKTLKHTLENGIDPEDFLAIKNKHIGRFIRGFNSIDAICMSQLDLGMLGYDLIQGFECVNEIDSIYLDKIIKDKLRIDKMALSIISN